MRKYIAILMILLLSVSTMIAGELENDATKRALEPSQGEAIVTSGTVGTSDTIVTRTFGLQEYDGYVYPNDGSKRSAPYAYIATSESATPEVVIEVEGSYDNENFFIIDTPVDSVTAETLQNGTSTIFSTVVPYYRIRIIGTASNASDTEFDFRYYIPWQKD